MPTPTPNQTSVSQSADTAQTLTSPLRCLVGALISGAMAFALYLLTSSIAQSFAAKPVTSTNPLTINIAVAVRTLVTGVSTLATGVFGLVTIGLVALAIQIMVQRLTKKSA